MTEESLFLAALDHPDPDARRRFLDDACAHDPDLRKRLDVLLAAFAAGRDRLEPPTAATADFHPRPEPGTVIAGKYKLLEPIGEGGMGEVWVAKQTEPVHRKVALKLIKPGMDSKQVLTRFEAERQALAMMDHPNIAKVLDGGIVDGNAHGRPAVGFGRPFFVMELVNGQPLTRFCDEARLTPRQRLELFVPVCQAVQHAHQKGVVHRDLKPSNILVTLYDGKPVPKVIDFGVAKATGGRLTDESISTQFGAVVGTFEYMAPEQAGFSALDVDTRADIYSLGVILYELLTGLRPFDGARLRKAAIDEVFRILREEDPPRPSTKLSTDASLPSAAAVRGIEPRRLTALMKGELDWIVMKCLEKDRARRYETANGLARDVQRYLADEPVEARPPGTGYRVRKFVRRNRTAVTAAAAVFVALLAGFVGTAWGLVRAEDARRDAETARVAEADQRAAAEADRDRALKAEAEATRRKQEADEQAAAARAVSEFLREDLLGQADVRQQAERNQEADPRLTVREALDRAADRVGDRFRGKPVIEAAVRLTIGRTYLALTEPALAAPHLERAAALYRTAHGPDHPTTLDAQAQLGLAYAGTRRPADAVDLMEDVDRRARRALAPDHPVALRAAHNLGWAYRQAGRAADAVRLYEEVARREAALHGPTHSNTLTTRNNLAEAYQKVGRADRSLPLYEELLDLRRGALGPDHPDTLMAMNNLATGYWRAGHPDRALPLVEECLRRRRDRLGADHPLTIRTRVNLGINYREVGRADDAVRELAGAVEQARRRPPPDLIGVNVLVRELCEAYTRAGRHAEAEPLFRAGLDQALAKGDRPGDLAVAQARAPLGLNLLRQRKYADAEPVLRACLAARERADPDGWATAYTRSMLGDALRGQKKYAEAEPLLVAGAEPLLARPRAVPMPARPQRLAEVVDRVVRLYEETGLADRAAEWRARRPPEEGPAPREVK